jgi:competence protein ComEC
LPILIVAFGSVSLISPLANAIAVPLFTLILTPLVLVGTACASISIELGRVVLNLASQVLATCWPALEWLAAQPLAMWYLPEMSAGRYALLAIGALLFVLPRALPLRIAALFLCVPALSFRPASPLIGDYELTVLDVGQGLAIVVRTHSHTLVYDAGPAFRTGRDTGELVVLPFLRHRGVKSLDRLMISHGDLDHRGGMQSVLDGMPTHSVILGPSVLAPMVRSQACIAGQIWSWDDVSFEIVHPLSGAALKDNDTSCVLRISGRAGSTLLTGDIETEGEHDIVARDPRPADIVVIAHHGSRTSSTDEFVRVTQPSLGLVSAGYRNRWNFPKADVVQRWRDAGTQVISTIDSGAIDVSVSATTGISVRHYRVDHHRYWSPR